ncbi:MAG: AAA family ATPase, partial [Bacteroidota bacterium]
TGETGAGKSIILGALSLILGQRADPKALRDTGKKCVVEGTFSIDRYRLQGFFEAHDLDYEGSTMLRREIAVNGKSRAFINDTPVGLAQLKELGAYLIDIHSQHETLSLNQPDVQLSLVDAFAGLQEQVREYRTAFNQYALQTQELEALEAEEQQARLDRDYWQFQWEELSQANLEPNEQEALEAEVHTLAHAEEIKTALVQAVAGLREAEDNPLSRLHQLQPLLQRVQGHHAGVRELAERLASVAIELDDIVDELETAGEQVVHDPERLVTVNDRLDVLYALQQKHRVQTVDGLIALRESLDRKLRDGVSLEDRISALRTANATLLQELTEAAAALSEQRAAALPGLADQVHATLAELQMPHARLHLEQELLAAPGPSGVDQIRWLFAANKGSVPRPL